MRNGDVADTYLVAHWQPYPFLFPFPQTGTNPHRYESGRTQNESGRDGKGESGGTARGRAGRMTRGRAGGTVRGRAGGTTRGQQEGEQEGRREDSKRENGRDVEGVSHPRMR